MIGDTLVEDGKVGYTNILKTDPVYSALGEGLWMYLGVEPLDAKASGHLEAKHWGGKTESRDTLPRGNRSLLWNSV